MQKSPSNSHLQNSKGTFIILQLNLTVCKIAHLVGKYKKLMITTIKRHVKNKFFLKDKHISIIKMHQYHKEAPFFSLFVSTIFFLIALSLFRCCFVCLFVFLSILCIRDSSFFRQNILVK